MPFKQPETISTKKENVHLVYTEGGFEFIVDEDAYNDISEYIEGPATSKQYRDVYIAYPGTEREKKIIARHIVAIGRDWREV